MAEQEGNGCGCLIFALIAMIGPLNWANENWGVVKWWIRVGTALATLALVGYVFYRCRHLIGKFVRGHRERATEEQAARELEGKLTLAEKAVLTYYDGYDVQIRDDISRDEVEQDIRRNLRHLKNDRDIADWREDWLSRLKPIIEASDRNEQQDGPNERTAARERVRLHFLKHRGVFRNRDFDGVVLTYDVLETLIENHMGDGVPMAEVVTEGWRLIETIDKLVIQADVRDCYHEHRNLISDSEFHAFYKNFLDDQLNPKSTRPIADFERAATTVKQLIRQAVSDGRPEAVTEHEKQLWDKINEKRGEEWTDAQKERWVVGQLEAWKSEQGY